MNSELDAMKTTETTIFSHLFKWGFMTIAGVNLFMNPNPGSGYIFGFGTLSALGVGCVFDVLYDEYFEKGEFSE